MPVAMPPNEICSMAETLAHILQAMFEQRPHGQNAAATARDFLSAQHIAQTSA